MDQTTIEDVHKSGDKDKRERTGRQHANRKPDDDRVFLKDKPCVSCGRKHRKGRTNCAAWGRVCRACGKKNPFTSQCSAREKTHNIEVEDESSGEEFLYCVTMKPAVTETVNSILEWEIYAKMLINEKPVKFHIDCGATVNVLTSKYVNKDNIQPMQRVLQMWNKTALKPEGVCCVAMRNPKNRKKYSVEFIVVKENLTPLLGTKMIQQMKLIEIHEENHSDNNLCNKQENPDGPRNH